jgi:hypothetical protein
MGFAYIIYKVARWKRDVLQWESRSEIKKIDYNNIFVKDINLL